MHCIACGAFSLYTSLSFLVSFVMREAKNNLYGESGDKVRKKKKKRRIEFVERFSISNENETQLRVHPRNLNTTKCTVCVCVDGGNSFLFMKSQLNCLNFDISKHQLLCDVRLLWLRWGILMDFVCRCQQIWWKRIQKQIQTNTCWH